MAVDAVREEQLPSPRALFFWSGVCLSGLAALLFVLHGAQPLAAKGPALSADSLSLKKKASYRVVLHGTVDRPTVLQFKTREGAVISAPVKLEPSLAGSNSSTRKILKARASAAEARLVSDPSFGGEIELRALDERAPLRRWTATLLFLALLVRPISLQWRRPWARALALGLAHILFLIPWDVPGFYAFSSDSRYYVPTSMSWLQRGDWNLDEFDQFQSVDGVGNDYRVRQGKDGHWYNLYPPGTSLLCLPLVLIGDWLNDEIPDSLDRAAAVSAFAAKVLSAATVALFFLVALTLTSRPSLAWILTFVFAFATPQLGTHGGGLWSHTASVFCATLGLGLWVWKGSRFAALTAIPLAFGFACRPTMALPAAVFGIALLLEDRRKFALFSALSALCLGAFVYHSLGRWGTVLPPYYTGHVGHGLGSGLSAFAGTLLSPNRGLFVFCPILIFAVAGGLIARRTGQGKIYLLASIVAVLEWLVASRNGMWWGGHCYGPRLLCEIIPFAILLLIPAWEAIAQHRARRLFLLGAIFSCAWGIFVQAQALTNKHVYEWNAAPNIDFNPVRLWDWRDLQIFAR